MNELAPINGASKSYCTFRIERRLHGIDIARVREVSQCLPMTPVPQAPAAIRGLVNLRSRIHLLLDPRPLLGFAPLDGDSDSRLIILKADVGQDLALLVERGGDIVHVKLDQIEPLSAADSSGGTGAALIIGACKLASELLLIVDPTKLIEVVQTHLKSGVSAVKAAVLENTQ